MSGITLTADQRANVSSYLAEVWLPDTLEGRLHEQEGISGITSERATLASAVIGAAIALANTPITVIGGAVLAVVLPGLVTENLSRFTSPSNPAAARVQADNFYWYLVKRQIFCNLPSNTGDINDTLVARIADEIENIVPYDGNDFGSKTSANQFLSSFLRSIPVSDLRNIIEIAAQRWTGNRNGLALPEVSPGCLTPTMALIPIIGIQEQFLIQTR
ncbi:MAG: hypothetical protein SF123_07930 [Chloroflexota bacterium]|nr:hypothetical protein [Chloroflexota bacterium]